MIYTVTLNPAVDYVVHVPALTQGQVSAQHPGSRSFLAARAFNVSSVLHTLGVASVATGFLAGVYWAGYRARSWRGRALGRILSSCRTALPASI